jgi:cation diffusion facilitator family transporter
MAKGSTRVVCVALAGNVAIAAAKFGAYFLSGSSGMFTEAIHSLVDSIDQVLLLVGQARGRKPADATHPLGHGMEAYFWSFVVAIMVLMLGGGVSVYEGLQRLREPAPIASPLISFGVLGVAALFDGLSLLVGIREYKRVVRDVRGQPVGLWRFIQLSKDPSLYASLLEDSFALVGVGIAALGVLGTSVFHIAAADGAASLAIGVLLAVMAMILANETRSLIAGEAVAPPVLAEIRRGRRSDRLRRRGGNAASWPPGNSRGAHAGFHAGPDAGRLETSGQGAHRRHATRGRAHHLRLRATR